MTFVEAMEAIGVSAVELSEALGYAPQTIRQMRLDPSSANYREPPDGWRRILADYARARGAKLAKVADQLEREAARLRK